MIVLTKLTNLYYSSNLCTKLYLFNRLLFIDPGIFTDHIYLLNLSLKYTTFKIKLLVRLILLTI